MKRIFFIISVLVYSTCLKLFCNTSPFTFILQNGVKIQSQGLIWNYSTNNNNVILYQAPSFSTSHKVISNTVFSIINISDDKYWFYILSSDYHYGWINIDQNYKLLKKGYYSLIDKYKTNDEINNSYYNAMYIEKYYRHEKLSFNRKGPLLEITFLNNKEIFIDSLPGEKCSIAFNLNSIYLDRYFLVHHQYYEGHVYSLNDIYTKKVLAFLNNPPLFSPNNIFFVSLGSRYLEPETLSIHQILGDGQIILAMSKNSKELFPHNNYPKYTVKWISNSCIQLEITGENIVEKPILIMYDSKNKKWNMPYTDYFI